MSSVIFEKIEGAGLYRRIKRRINHSLADFLQKEALSGRRRARILEAACGSAYICHLLASAPEVQVAVGLDNNILMYKLQKIGNFQGNLVLGDIYSMPFKIAAFDLIWNSSSIEELPDPRGAVKAMTALIAPGGYVFVGVPYRYGPLGIYHFLPCRKLKAWIGKPFSGKMLKDYLESAGLRVEKEIKYLARFFIGMLARKPE